MRNRDRWEPYLSVSAFAILEALKISERYTHDRAPPFADVCIDAQQAADDANAPMVVGWQINDDSGNKEPGFGPLAALSLLTLEPVALVYPLPRELPCKPPKRS